MGYVIAFLVLSILVIVGIIAIIHNTDRERKAIQHRLDSLLPITPHWK